MKPSALRKALASLPKTMDDTYERILCNINEEYAEDALKILQWLAFSARLLGLREVAEATAITLDDIPRFHPEDRIRHYTDVLAICSSLVSVSAPVRTWRDFGFVQASSEVPQSLTPSLLTGDRCVRLAHYSVKKYLVSERIKRSKAALYNIGEASANAFLAGSCLAYLVHFEQPFCDLVSRYMAEYPLLRYSASEWDVHLSSSGYLNRDTCIDLVLKEFFLSDNSSFANWKLIPQLGQYNLRKRSPLYYASRSGLLDIGKNLLEQGVSIDGRTKSTTRLFNSRDTPLFAAAIFGHETVVSLLLDHIANVSQRDSYLSATYHMARDRVATYYLDATLSLLAAVCAGHVEVVKVLLEKQTIDVGANEYKVLYRDAIAGGHRAVADLLKEYGADPNNDTRSSESGCSDDDGHDHGSDKSEHEQEDAKCDPCSEEDLQDA